MHKIHTETRASCTLTPADNDQNKAKFEPQQQSQPQRPKRDFESKRVDARVAVTP